MEQLPDIKNANQLRGARTIVRGSLNVPVENGAVADPFRLESMRPTLDFLRAEGARIVLVGHFGRAPDATLAPVFEYLKQYYPLTFIEDPLSDDARAHVDGMSEGDIALSENLRRYPGEEANDPGFARTLAALGDVYVNEAFSASHRAHASIVGLPRILSRRFAGVRFQQEVENVAQVFRPVHPFIAIIGGAKFETKVPIIEKFLSNADAVFVGGAIANDFFKAEGYEIGESLRSRIDVSHMLLNEKLHVPHDVVVEGPHGRAEKSVAAVSVDERILDIGPESVAEMCEAVRAAKLIVWNGPLGNYENGYETATRLLAEAIAESRVPAIIGGGDTASAIRESGTRDKFAFISTAGGALLEFLVKETLPGIEALREGSVNSRSGLGI